MVRDTMRKTAKKDENNRIQFFIINEKFFANDLAFA